MSREKFPIGTKVRVKTDIDRNQIGNINFLSNEGTVTLHGGNNNVIMVDGYWVFQGAFEIIPPQTFEVGKWYVHKSYALPAFEVVYLGKYKALVRRGDDEWTVSLKNFEKHKEYIPPPPEEWRALFYRKDSRPEISANFWSSKKEVEESESGRAFEFMYAIRTDINVKKEK